jgi:predicted phosphodiesterase
MLIEQFILDVAEDFPVNVAFVTGNESRVRDHHAYSEMLVTDNYDWTIAQILKLVFRNNDRVQFIESADSREVIINLNGKNLLLVHGDTIGNSGVDKKVTQLKDKIALKYGVIIDYVIFGHIHESYCSSMFSRSGSLVGANNYSDDALMLSSRASQNIYIFNKNYIEPCVIDVQDPVGVSGYYIDDTLKAYNVKGAVPPSTYEIRKII